MFLRFHLFSNSQKKNRLGTEEWQGHHEIYFAILKERKKKEGYTRVMYVMPKIVSIEQEYCVSENIWKTNDKIKWEYKNVTSLRKMKSIFVSVDIYENYSSGISYNANVILRTILSKRGNSLNNWMLHSVNNFPLKMAKIAL